MAQNIHIENWRLVPFQDGWQMRLVELLCIVPSWIWALRLCFGSQYRRFCSMMRLSHRSRMIANHSLPERKCWIHFTLSSPLLPIVWSTSQLHPSVFNLSLCRHLCWLLQLWAVCYLNMPVERILHWCYCKINIAVQFADSLWYILL